MTTPVDELKKVTIYTDGACLGNPGPGGYAVVLLFGPHRKELSGGFRHTTSNRMELMAAIVGLEALKFRCDVTVYSDSQYLVESLTKGWARHWQSNGWMRNKDEQAVNVDLWERLLALCDRHQVTFVWTKGHDGNRENERCDQHSRQAAGEHPLAVDDEYERRSQPDRAARTKSGTVKITREGQPCRKCGTPVVKRTPRTQHKPGQE